MSKKTVVVDIVSDARKFVDGMEEALKEISKAAKKSNALNIMRENIIDLQKQANDFKDVLEHIKPDIHAVEKINKKIKVLSASVRDIQQAFENININLEVKNKEKLNNEIFDIKLQVDDLKDSLKDVKGFLSGVLDIKNASNSSSQVDYYRKRLISLKNTLKELDDLKNPFDDFDSNAAYHKLKEYENILAKLLVDEKALKDQLAGTTDSSKRSGLSKQITDIQGEIAKASKSIIYLQKQAGVELFKDTDLQYYVDRSVSVIKNSINSIEEYFKKHKINYSEMIDVMNLQLKDGKVTIPIQLDDASRRLKDELSLLISELSDTVKPIDVQIRLTSVFKTKKKKEIEEQLNVLENSLGQLDPNSDDAKIAKSTLENIRKQFDKELSLNIKTNINTVEKQITAGLERIKQVFSDNKIGIYPNVKVELKEDDKQSLEKQIEELGDALKLKVDLGKSFECIRSEIESITDQTPVDSWANNFLEALDKIQQKLKVLFNTNSPNDFINDWTEADNIMFAKNGKQGLRERGAYFNSKTGYTSNTFTIGQDASYNLCDEIFKNCIEEVDTFIHSHPSKYANMSLSHYRKNEKDENILHGGDILAFYHDFINNKIKTQIVNSLNEIQVFDAEKFYTDYSDIFKNSLTDNDVSLKIATEMQKFGTDFRDNYKKYLIEYITSVGKKTNINLAQFNNGYFKKYKTNSAKDQVGVIQIYSELEKQLSNVDIVSELEKNLLDPNIPKISDALVKTLKDNINFDDLNKHPSFNLEQEIFNDLITSWINDLVKNIQKIVADLFSLDGFSGEDVYRIAMKNNTGNILKNALGIDNFDDYVKTYSNEEWNQLDPLGLNKNKNAFDNIFKNTGIDDFSTQLHQIILDVESLNKSLNEGAFQKAFKVDISDDSISKLSGLLAGLSETLRNNNSQVTTLPLQNVQFNNLPNELKEITKLRKLLKDVIKLIDEKTAAFKNEEKAVASSIPNETKYIGKLVSALTRVKSILEELSNDIGTIDFSNIKHLSSLNKLKPENFSNIAKSIKELSENINNINLNKDNILVTLQNILGKTDELKALTNVLKHTKSIKTQAKKQTDLQKAQNLLTNEEDNIRGAGVYQLESSQLNVLYTELEATSKGTVRLKALVQDLNGEFKEYTLETSDGLSFITSKVEDGTNAVLKQAEIWKKLHNATSPLNSTSDIEFIDKTSPVWQNVTKAAAGYKKELGEIVSIIRSVRKNAAGEVLESFKIIGDTGSSITIGQELEEVALKQGIYDISDKIYNLNSLKQQGKIYFSKVTKDLSTFQSVVQNKFKNLGFEDIDISAIQSASGAIEKLTVTAKDAAGQLKTFNFERAKLQGNGKTVYNGLLQTDNVKVKSNYKTLTEQNELAAKSFNELYKHANKYYQLMEKSVGEKLTADELVRLTELIALWDKAINKKDEYAIANGGSKVSQKHANDAYDNFINHETSGYIAIVRKELDTLETRLNKLDITKYTESARNEMEELRTLIKQISVMLPLNPTDKATLTSIDQLRSKSKEFFDSLTLLASQTSISKLSGKISTTLNKNSAMADDLKAKFISLRNELESYHGVIPLGEFERLKEIFFELDAQMKKTGQTGSSFIDLITSKTKGMFASLIAQYLSFYDIIRYIRNIYGTIRDYNTALTEMNKVSEESIRILKQFQEESYGTASSIGVTAKEIQNSTADFMRLGYSLKEAKELAKDANIYANVGDMEIGEATEHMISSVKAWSSEFKNDIEASEAIVDKYNEIGNNYAITSADIGSAMERSAAALKAGGNTLDEALGLITAGNLIQQDADATANALKVVSLRIRGSKTELEEMGESTDDLADSTSKLRGEIKALTGVDVMLDDNTYKSTAQIIKEIGEVYKQLHDVSQASLLEKLAGKTRASVMAGLLENYELIDDVMESATNAEGSAIEENERYMASIEGHVAQFKNAVDDLITSLIDSGVINWFIDLGTIIVKIADGLATLASPLGTILGIGAGVATFKNFGRTKMFVLFKYAEFNKCSLGY